MVDSKDQPLILGAPFLTTVGAIIDYEKKMVVLKNVDSQVSYPIEPPIDSCGQISNGEAHIGIKVSTMVEETPICSKEEVEIKNLVENEIKDDSLLVMVPPLEKVEKNFEEEVNMVKVAKVFKKKKLRKAKCEHHESSPPSLTFKPLNVIDGKLECKVTSKGSSKPFAKARIILDPGSKTDDVGIVNAKMAHVFGMKLNDQGPFQDGSHSTNARA